MNEPRAVAQHGFRVQCESGQPGTPVHLNLAGHLDSDGAPVLSEELRRLLDSGVTSVVLDFKEVPFISSLGMGCLIVGIGDFEGVGGELVITGLSNDLRQMFEVLDLLDYLKVR